MKFVRAAVTALILSCVASAAAAQTTPAAAPVVKPALPGQPSLIVTIVVDQFSGNLFNQYRDRFTGGLKTLEDQGLVYANGYQQHAMTETCPGHSTILTGANPERTGIPANDWIDRTSGEEVYCLAALQNTLAHGKNTDNGPVGPDQLQVTTLGDWLKASSPTSRVYAVSGKDRGAINLNGHKGDGAFWYTANFGFTTYVEPGQQAQARLAPVAALNSRINARLAANPPVWDYTNPICRTLEGDWTIGGQAFHAGLPRPDAAIDNTPLLDELTLEAATTLAEDQQLGRRGVTDMLGVSLSATDRIGHGFGTQGPEMCEQMYRLDLALGSFLDNLAAKTPGGILVVLTADHGGSDFPERQHERGYHDAGRGDPGILSRANATLKAQFGLTENPLAYGSSGVMVVGKDNKGLPQPLRDQVAAAALPLLAAEPLISGVWTQAQVLASPMPAPDASPQELSLLQRQRLSAVVDRSPDIILALNPNITASAGRVGRTISSHGTPWDYDRRVPILFWSSQGTAAGLIGQERFLPIRTIDIAPTLANVIGVKPADSVEGRCLDLGLSSAPACASGL